MTKDMKKAMKNALSRKSGFTLLEVLIAASLFVVVATISTVVFINTVYTEQRGTMKNNLYEDARIVMEQMTNLIRNNAIDYDEYFSMDVLQGGIDGAVYGLYNGLYGSRFYHPGLRLNGTTSNNPDDLGVECSYPVGATGTDCQIIYTLSQDYTTGQNPYTAANNSQQNTANAFCDQTLNSGSTCSNTPEPQSELYLINEANNHKTIVGRKKIKDNTVPGETDDYAAVMLELEGLDADQNGVTDLFDCAPDYKANCTPSSDPRDNFPDTYFNNIDYPDYSSQLFSDLGISFARKQNDNRLIVDSSPFAALTPYRSTVTRLQFIINPVEDPYRAYAENAMQIHPSVTIILEMELSQALKNRYPGEAPPHIVLQRTVSTGIHDAVESYPPTNDLHWIADFFKNLYR